MNYELPSSIVTQSEEFWDSEGTPLLRKPNPGDQILILDWSLGQEQPVLLSREPNGDEDYGAAAAEAAYLLPGSVPSTFTSDGKFVAHLSSGFYDGNCDRYEEITFPEYWHATLLQFWMDANEIPICIRPSSRMQDDKVTNDHVDLAQFSFDRTTKYAGFKAMGIRHKIREYVGECWRTNRALPQGLHTLPGGVEVTFFGPNDLFIEYDLHNQEGAYDSVYRNVFSTVPISRPESDSENVESENEQHTSPTKVEANPLRYLSEAQISELAENTEAHVFSDNLVEIFHEQWELGSHSWYDDSDEFPKGIRTWLMTDNGVRFLSRYLRASGQYIDCQDIPWTSDLVRHFQSALDSWFGQERASALVNSGKPSHEEDSFLQEKWSREAFEKGGEGSRYLIGEIKHTNGMSVWFYIDHYLEQKELVDVYKTYEDALHGLTSHGYIVPDE